MHDARSLAIGLGFGLAATLALGCGESTVDVHQTSSSTEVDGADVAQDAEVDIDIDIATDADAAGSDTALDDTAVPDGTDATTADAQPDQVDPPGPTPADPPPAPVAGDRVEVVSVSIRTSEAEFSGTDDGVEICLGASNCWRLNTPEIDDRENGNTEVYHFANLDLARAELDRMTIATTSTAADNNRWSPACIEVRLDGEPVYCNQVPVHIGTGSSANEVPAWTDPAGLTENCTTCWADKVTHGPMIGPPDTDEVRVAVRTDATRLTGLRLGTTRDLTTAPVVAWAYPDPLDDFTTDLAVDGLAPDTEYFYRVEVDGDQSQPVRSIRTAPTADQKLPARIAFGSCSRLFDQPIFTPILAGQPDLFLFVGDNNYANSHYRDALRWHYRNHLAVRERAELVANVPTSAIWDDHDFVENNSNGTCLDRDEALAAFQEYWANPAHGTAEAPGVYFDQRWGAVELFMLDCRMYRPDVGDGGNDCEPDPNPPALDVADGPLGPVQEAWLFERLAQSDATFKLVSCGSRFNPDGSLDSWRAFPAAYERLTQHIADAGVDGVVFLSGDIHRSTFAELPGVAYDIPELTSSPLALSSQGSCGTNPWQTACLGGTNSYIELEIDPTLADPTLTAHLKDETGLEHHTWAIRLSELTAP